MEIVEKKQETLPDFVMLKQRFDAMGSGPRAEMRRVNTVGALADLPAYYHWLQGGGSDARLQRVAFLVPYVKHKPGSPSLGQQCKKAGVSEMRLFQVIRSSSPRDLEQLRRLIIQVEPQLDWNEFGPTLYFWGKAKKQRILEQYFTPIKKQQ
ncbi:MAG: type I-E CRISPR-associated protein Cse2/CasB [Pseudomonadota bacterium]